MRAQREVAVGYAAQSGTERSPRGRPALIGTLAGLIGIGCCVYPVVLVLFGVATATAALDLGNRLFAEWGWAFKLAGASSAALAVATQWRRAKACPADARPSLRRNVLMVVGTALLTYGLLYGVTTGLGRAAT